MSMVPKGIENIYQAHKSRVWTMASIDHRHVATGSEDGTIRIWNFYQGICIHILSGHQLAVFSIISLDDGKLLSASKDGTMKLWDILSGRCCTVVTESSSILTLLKFGSYIASGSHPFIKIYRISDLSSYKPHKNAIATLNGHSNSVYCLANSEKFLVSGSKDFSIIIWDISSFAFMKRFFGHTSTVCDVTIKNETLISSSLDSTIRVWDTRSGDCLKVLNQHNGCIHSIIHHDKFFISAGRDSRIIGWDLNKFGILFNFEDQNAVIDVMMMENGCLIGGSVDGNISISN
eukprot:gene12219-5805_t